MVIIGEVLEQHVAEPVYCRQCNSSKTFKRDPDKDIVSESGKVLWEYWSCSVCGNHTVRPVDGKILTKEEGI